MLDPDAQRELGTAAGTVTILHMAMLCEPIVYVVVALVMKRTGFGGVASESQPFLSSLRSVLILVSIGLIPAIVFIRRALFAPERIFPSGADMQKVGMLWTRSQLVIDVLAVTPATLGLVFFIMSGSMDFLVGLSMLSLVVLSILFPRAEKIEEAAMARIMQGGNLRPIGRE